MSAVLCGVALAGEEVEQFADGGLRAGWLGQREVGLDLVAVAAAVLVLGHVAGTRRLPLVAPGSSKEPAMLTGLIIVAVIGFGVLWLRRQHR